jgi:hypothetical protein
MYDTLTTAAILQVFGDEVELFGGRVRDTYHDQGRLFVRSLLPNVRKVRPKDKLQAGLALRATEEELWLHPYLFRQVCSNGAIMAHALESLHVECLGAYSLDEGTEMLREAIVRCSAPEVFARSVRRVRSTAAADAETLLSLMPQLAPLQNSEMRRYLDQILARYIEGSDRNRFGLMNAVTSVARDTRDPDARWRLEELGGGIGARLRPRRPAPAPERAHCEPFAVLSD